MAQHNLKEPLTVLVSPEMKAILRARAEHNHRSVTKEIVFMIETALAVESEDVRKTLHVLFKAGAEVME